MKNQEVSQYINSFSKEVATKLSQVREAILEAEPALEEGFSYKMPSYKLGKPVAYFAAYKNHIGFYPTPSPISQFEKDLAPYKVSKGAIQFPLNQNLPLDLIKKIVKFRVSQITKPSVS